jgi:PAS domain S-box-containing protein
VKKREPDRLIDTASEQTDKRIQRGEAEPCFFSPDATPTDFYSQLFEHAVEAMLVCNTDGVISHINRRAVSLLGYFPDEIVTHPYTKLFPTLTEPLALQRLQHSVLAATATSWETDVVRRDGTRLPVEVRIGVLPGKVGKFQHVHVVLRDISQKKNVERQRADFLEMLAHDIRSPLSVVLGYADLLLSEAKSRASSYEETDMLLSLCSGAFSLATLVMNYLDLAKIESRPVVVAKGPVALRELLSRVKKQYEREAQRLQVSLEFFLPDELPLVRGDTMALERVVTNLLHNALKFTLEKGKVTIGAFVRHNDEVVLSVTDTGVGMTAEEIAVVFEKYRTAKRDRKREGSGLGLFIVKALVEAHGGRVEVDSTPGVGTCMSVVLPTVTNGEGGKPENP